MRFFKIFLICFFSLIGTVSGVIGIMYVAGALDEKVVEPEAIAFEFTEYNLDGDTIITISSPTPEVTATAVTLSLPNQTESINEDNGEIYITNEIITVPKTVYIGQPFIVEVYTEYDTEIGKNWVAGGNTVLTAKSESLIPNQVTANVNVDVPVENISVITYPNSTAGLENKIEQSTFAVNEIFYAEAVFSPARSMYKYGTTETKKVFFDISTNDEGIIEESTEITNLSEFGNITAYKVLSSLENEDFNIYAYCFETARLENMYVEEYDGNIESLIGELKSSNNNITNSANLNLTSRTVGSFTINKDINDKTLEFNKINKIYANKSGVDRNANFGIEINDNSDDPGDSNALQNKIRDVGIAAYIKTGTVYTLATNKDLIFVDSLTGALSTKTRTDNGITYYLPNAVSTNIDNSFWNVVALKENLTVKFDLYLFNNNDVISLDSPKISTEDVLYKQTWRTLSVDVSTLVWTNTNDINLTVIDNVDPTKISSEEFDISSIISMSEGGTYQTVKYLAYSVGDLIDLSTVLVDCEETDKYSVSGISYTLFELKSTILKPSADCDFEVIAVIIKTDYLGHPILIDRKYQIYQAITDGTTSQSYKNVSVLVNKTVKDLSVALEVSSDDLLGNNTDEEITELDKISFASNSGSTSVFDIVFKVQATEETLLSEVQIFAEAYNNGLINFNAYFSANLTDIVFIDKPSAITIDPETVSGTEWTYKFNVFTNDCERDTEIKIIWTYEKTSSTIIAEPIKAVNFAGDLTDLWTFKETVDWATIEVYDARVTTVEFEFDNDADTELTETITIQQGAEVYENVYFANEPNIAYFSSDDADVTSEVLTEDNEYKINFYDKFGNVLENVATTDYVIRTTTSGKVVEVTNHASSISSNPTDTLYVETASSGQIQSVGKNVGVIENGEWAGDDITNNFTTIEGYTLGNEISISRTGIIKEGEIAVQITGSNGLLSVLYLHDEIMFELCNILAYTFVTNIADLSSVISYDSETGALTLLTHINKQLELVLNVNSGLGFSFNVKLLILPNILLTTTMATAQGAFSEEVDVNGYYNVYSDNDVIFNLNFTMTLKEAFVITTSAFHFALEGNPTSATISLNELKQQIQLVVNFSSTQLGQNTIRISTGATTFDFYREIKINVIPNLKLTSETNKINKTVEVIELGTAIEILTASDYARVIGATEIDASALTLTYSKVLVNNNTYYDEIYFNGQTTPILTNDIISIIGNDSINVLKTLEGFYKVVLKLNYGGETIGTIEVLVKPNIKPDETNENYSSMFAYYNGTQCLVLVSGQSYLQGTLIALFKNVSYFALGENTEIYTYEPTTNTYEIRILFNFDFKINALHLKNVASEVEIASIYYPVLFSPLDVAYVSYQGGEDSENLATINSDLGKLNSPTELFNNNIYDSYSSGTAVSLFRSESQTYGLASSVKESNLVFETFLENEDGTISNVEYGSFDANNGMLTTNSSSEDKFVYLVIYDSEMSHRIGLYRLKIVANSAINIYYPYDSSYFAVNDIISAEYVYETNNIETTINFDETLPAKYPNSVSSTSVKRVMLQLGNTTDGFNNSTDYTVSYKILKLIHFDEEITNLSTIINDYGISFEGNVLSICKKDNDIERVFEIVIECTVTSGNVDMGIVYYRVMVNNPEIYKYNLKDTSQTTTVDYAVKNMQVTYGNSYEFDTIVLFKSIQNGISSPATDVDLKYHVFIENKIASDYLTFDEVNKTLSIKAGIEIVSNLKVKFVYYIVYGEILTTELTFLSNFNTEFVAENGLTESATANTYEVFADTTFDLKNIFTIKNGEDVIDVSTIDYSYTIDNGNEISGNEMSFTQITTATESHTIKLIVHLYEFNSTVYKDDFEVEFNLIVKQSMKTNASNNPLKLNDPIKFQTSDYELNAVLISTILGSTDTLFSVQDASILTGYTLTPSTQNLDYLSVSPDLALNKITLSFKKSPNEYGKEITITFTLTKDGFSLSAILKFTLNPDVKVLVNYPQPNKDSTLSQEKLFLDPSYISGSTGEETWGTAGYLTINLSDVGYFGENRINFLDFTDNETIVDYADLSTRLTLKVYSIKQNDTEVDTSAVIVSYVNGQSQRIIGTQISGISLNSDIFVQWRSADPLDISTAETILFEILIDNIHRAYYTIVLCSDMTDIFTTTLNYLYEDITGIEGEEAEIFYVEYDTTEKLFSNQTALLKFTSRPQSAPTKLTIYVKDETFVLRKVGEVVIGTNSLVYNCLLVGDNELKSDLSNLVIKVNDDTTEYVFTDSYENLNNICNTNNCIMYNSASLSYRLSVSYQGQKLDYAQYIQKVEVALDTPVYDFNINKASLLNIETPNPIEVPIKIGSQVIGNYYYKVKYDFVVGKSIDKTPDAIEITAPNSLESGVATFDISGLKGDYPATYFADNKVEFNAQIIMVTKIAFGAEPTTSNVLYIADGMLSYCQTINENLTIPPASSNSNWLSISALNIGETNIKYDFRISAYGAENEGNYAFILITYGAKSTEAKTFKIVKVKINPNLASMVLSNLDTTTNSENSPLEVRYAGINALPITLGTNGTTSDPIFLTYGNTTNLICDPESLYSLTLNGEIADYLELYMNDANKTANLRQKTGTEAILGDKYGYITIVDKFGYSENYYIHLYASSTVALSLPSEDAIFINPIEGTVNQFYTGTEICIVKESYNEAVDGELGDTSAARIVNLEASGLTINNYTVHYRIDGVLLEESEDNIGILPNITEAQRTVDLEIIISITTGTITEQVVLTTEITLIKRFVLKTNSLSSIYVREGVNFDVADFITIEDVANRGNNIGDVSISTKSKLLIVDATLIGRNLIVSASTTGQASILAQIIVGKDQNNKSLTAIGGYYYHILQLYDTLEALNFENYEIAVSGTYDEGQVELVDDMVVYLVTSKIEETPTISVKVNNGVEEYSLTYTLNIDGKQAKSIYQEISTDSALNEQEKTNKLTNIYNYQISSDAISEADLQTLKNFTIYNDTLAIKIKGGYAESGINLKVKVYYDATHYKFAEYGITNNNTHYKYVSISSILGDLINITGTYKIVIEYVAETSAGNLADLITFDSSITYSSSSQNNVVDEITIYTKTIDTFAIASTTQDVLKILSASDFDSTKKKQNAKYYLVKYSNEDTVEQVAVTYNITPKYFSIDNEDNIVANAKIVYANQYETSVDTLGNKTYTVPFIVWASAFNLLDGGGSVLASMNNGADLVFDLRGVNASGSATFNANFDIVTNSGYNDGEYFVITVKVKINEQTTELVEIGSVQVQLDHSNIFVAVKGQYTIIIKNPNDINSTVNTMYNFTSNIVSVYNLIMNNANLEGFVRDNEEGISEILIGSQYIPISTCNIEIVNIVDGIYSVEYNSDGNLEIKIKINESQTSLNKDITLQTQATNIANTSLIYTSPSYSLQLNYNGSYYVTSSLTGETSFTKAENGEYYVVEIPLASMFLPEQQFVGTDFTYAVNIGGVNESDLTILYSTKDENIEQQITLGQTLFFKLSFKDAEDNNNSAIIGIKYTEDNQNFGGDYGYSIDISNLTSINGTSVADITSYSISFLKAYDLNCTDDVAYNLLVANKSTNATTYSIASIDTYKSDQAFIVTDYAINKLSSGSLVSIYEESVIVSDSYHIPSYINVNTNAVVGTVYYYGVHNSLIVNMSLYGISTNTAGELFVDVSSYTNNSYVVIYDFNGETSKLTGDISGITDGATTYWQGNINNEALQYGVATIAKTTFAKGATTLTLFTFSDKVLLNGSNPISMTLVSTTADLTKIVTSPVNETMYSFEFTDNQDNKSYIAIAGSNLNAVAVADLVTTLNGGIYTFSLQDVTTSISTAGVINYVVYDASNDPIGIKAVKYTANGSYFVSTTNPLLIGATEGVTAIQSTTCSLDISANTMTYITIQYGLVYQYYAVLYDEATTFEYTIPALSGGNEIVLTVSTTGFTVINNNPDATVNFACSASETSQSFKAYDDSATEKTFEITAEQTEYALVLSDFGDTVNNLTITLL